METIKKYLMYLRKSRADSDSESIEDVLARHEAILQEYVYKKFGCYMPEENIFREVVSGETIDARPQIKKVLSLVANNDYEGVLVVEPQRLTRGDMLDCGTIIRVFRYNNVKIITPNCTYDLTNTQERKYLEMTLQQGNDYLEYIKTILGRGRLSSVKEGCYLGSKPPFGYDRTVIDGKHTLTPNADADTVRLIFDLFVNQDMGSHLVGLELERRGLKPLNAPNWHPATIRNIIRNPVYIGKIRWNNKKLVKVTDEFGNTKEKRDCKSPDKLLVDGLHQPIVSADLFEKAQRKFGNMAKVKANKEIVNPFASLIKCGRCGKTFLLRNRPERESLRLQCSNQIHCHSASIKFEPIKNAVVNALLAHIENYKVKIENDDGSSLKIQETILNKLKKEYAELSVQQSKLYDLLEKGIYSEALFLERQALLNENKAQLENAIKEQQSNLPAAIDYQEKILDIHHAIEMLGDDSVSAKEKNSFLKSIIDRIELTTPLAQREHRVHTDDIKITVILK